MILRQIMIKFDDSKLSISNKISSLSDNSKNAYESVSNYIINHKGKSILVVSFLLSLMDSCIWLFWGTVLYLLVELHRYLNYKMKRNDMNSLDVKLLSDKDTGIDKILSDYVEECFARDVLFFRGDTDSYINNKSENEMLNQLLDVCAANISPLMREKLEQYYGEGNVDKIIGRKCFSTVTVFVANKNKNIYH